MRVCEHAFKTGKIFAMTLSAKFICDNPIGVRLLSALPYADVVFGYEDVNIFFIFIFIKLFYFRKQNFLQKLNLMLQYKTKF
jgi:hypothetical protein